MKLSSFGRLLLLVTAAAAVATTIAAEDLTGKVVIITGATSGIGEAAAEHLASLGASVVLAGRRQEKGDAIVERCEAAGGQAIFVKTDVSKDADNANLFAQAIAKFGHVDSVYANAGVLTHDSVTAEGGADTIDYMVNINVIGTAYTIRHAMLNLVEGGSIIITSSFGGSIAVGAISAALPPDGGAMIYSATKSFLDGYARNIAGSSKFRVYTLAPGVYETEMAAGENAVGAAQVFHTYFKTPADARDLNAIVEHMVAGTTVWPSGSNVACEGKYTYDVQIRYNQLYGASRPTPNPLAVAVPPEALRDARGAPAGLTAETVAQIAAEEKAAFEKKCGEAA